MLKEKSTSISHRGFRRLADAEFNLTLVKSFVKIQHQGKKYQSNQVKSLHFGEFISLSDTYTGYRFDSQMLKGWGCCSLRMGLLLLLHICSAHLGSGPRYLGFLRNLPLMQRYFCAVYDYVEKADLSKGYQNPKTKLG